jgi:hypothetical protein
MAYQMLRDRTSTSRVRLRTLALQISVNFRPFLYLSDYYQDASTFHGMIFSDNMSFSLNRSIKPNQYRLMRFHLCSKSLQVGAYEM